MALGKACTSCRVRRTLVCFGTFLVTLISSTAQANGNLKMKTIPPLFETVQLGTPGETACTPKLGGWDYRGIKLNAPTKVTVSEEYILPLCGGWQFSDRFLNRFKDYYSMVVIVVTDMKTFKSYSGNLSEPGQMERRKMVGTDEELENNTSSVSFNIDLYDYIPSLPQKAGKFQIYALVGEVKSNVVEVEIEVAKGATPGPKPPQPM